MIELSTNKKDEGRDYWYMMLAYHGHSKWTKFGTISEIVWSYISLGLEIQT